MPSHGEYWQSQAMVVCVPTLIGPHGNEKNARFQVSFFEAENLPFAASQDLVQNEPSSFFLSVIQVTSNEHLCWAVGKKE